MLSFQKYGDEWTSPIKLFNLVTIVSMSITTFFEFGIATVPASDLPTQECIMTLCVDAKVRGNRKRVD